MSTLIQLAWATLERVFPRVASAVVMVAFAAFTAPDAVGIYSWVALTYTLYQAVAESALRNQAVLAVTNPRHVQSVRRSAQGAAFIGTLALAITLAVLWVGHGDTLGRYVLGLLPFLVVPFITTGGIVPVARMQFRQEWHLLARYQLIAAVAGLSVSFGVVVTTQSSLAMALHLLTTETVFLTLVRRRSSRLYIPPREGGKHPRKGMGSLVTLSTLGWCQSQLERVFVGGLAGVGTLGNYSTAVTMGRSPGEALSAATANYLRAQISAQEETAKHAGMVGRITTLSVLSTTAAVGAVLILVQWILTPILGEPWRVTLEAVPTLAVATIPYSISMALQVMAVYYDRPKASIIPAMLGVAFGPLIGVVALGSIHAAAFVVIAKELAVLLVAQYLARIPGAGRSVVLACACTAMALFLVEVVL